MEMNEYNIIKIKNHPELICRAAEWFHHKWHIHKRKDLTPNVCALYVEEDCRCRGIAGELLRFMCNDMREKGIDTLYLITDHTSFYERYGWEYLCMVEEDEGGMTRMYIHNGKE